MLAAVWTKSTGKLSLWGLCDTNGSRTGVSRTACLDAELHLRLLVRPRGKVVVLAQEVVIVCLCLKDTEIHATSKQGNTTNSALESLHSLHRTDADSLAPRILLRALDNRRQDSI